jgi:predicted metal-dependent hydrolase
MWLAPRASSPDRLGDLPLELRVSARARRLRLKVDTRTGTVILTVPPRTSKRAALAWAQGHLGWAQTMLAAIPDRLPLVPGATFPLFGEPHRIVHKEGPRSFAISENEVVMGGPIHGFEPRLLRALKARALTLLESETRALAAAENLIVSKVGIGDPRSRWGSCSSEGVIRYSWRLLLAPPFVRRATVAHEVAHLVHLDHGRDFHRLVRRLLGQDPGLARSWLRREGAGLHRIGSAY